MLNMGKKPGRSSTAPPKEFVGKIPEDLLAVFQSERSGLRQGALKELIQFVRDNTKLSKSDVRKVASDLAPVKVQTVSTGSKNQKSKKPRKVSTEIEELRKKFPNWKDGGSDSEYAKAVKALRMSKKG